MLITRPGERTYVSELAGAAGVPKADLSPVADRRALAAYRERLRRIDAELDSLGEGTPEAGAVRCERDALLAELSAAAGLGGRARTAGSPAERMRKAVTYRIRHAIAQVAVVHPVILGGGKSPFAGMKEPQTFRLAQTSAARNGRVVLMYRV